MSLAGEREAAGPNFDHGAFTNRYEVKYPVKSADLPEIAATIADYLVPDQAVNGGQGYQVTSIYFDSPDLRFFRSKMEGDLTRLKPRLRIYRDTADSVPSAYFLELKGRYDRIVLKRRTVISRDLAESLLRDPKDLPEPTLRDFSVFFEFAYMVQRFNLQPVVSVSYHRQPFVGRFHSNLRVTFDRMLQGSLSTTLDASLGDFAYFLPPNRSIIELKYNETISSYLLQRLHSLGMKQQTYSKYAESILKLVSRDRGR